MRNGQSDQRNGGFERTANPTKDFVAPFCSPSSRDTEGYSGRVSNPHMPSEIIIFVTWLYLTTYVILIGAELNFVLERRARQSPVPQQA